MTERRNEQTTLTHPAPISNLYVLMKIFWCFIVLMNFLKKKTRKLYFEVIFDSLEVAKVIESCVLLPLLLPPVTRYRTEPQFTSKPGTWRRYSNLSTGLILLLPFYRRPLFWVLVLWSVVVSMVSCNHHHSGKREMFHPRKEFCLAVDFKRYHTMYFYFWLLSLSTMFVGFILF